MTRNHTAVSATPPPAPPATPGYFPQLPGPPINNGRRRWTAPITAGVMSAVVTAAAAAVITLQVRDATTAQAPEASAPVTITVPAPTPAPPAPLPTAQADRQTCRARDKTSQLISAASEAQGVIPKRMTILDPAVRSNPDWTAGVQKAGTLYTQAGNTLKVASGTTPILADAVISASKALRALGIAYTNFDAVNGNAHEIAKTASEAMDTFCMRFAP
jgi:hypothetical protein